MKLITLNTWGGRANHNNFLDFLKKYSGEIDIFCLQEVWNVDYSNPEHVKHTGVQYKDVAGGIVLENIMHDLFGRSGQSLSNYRGFFRPHFGTHYGLAVFVNKNIDVKDENDLFVHKKRDFIPTGDVGNHARNIQYVNINTEKGLVTVVNFHGLWNGKGKTDTEDRLLQSENIVNFLKTIKNPFILCGDFNLLPDTESLKKFEKFGLRNLIKENGITTTRTSLYKKEHKFADYVFVSDGINVNDFKVLPDEVSDHSPIYLDFN